MSSVLAPIANTHGLGQERPSCRRDWLPWPGPATRLYRSHEALQEQRFRLNTEIKILLPSPKHACVHLGYRIEKSSILLSLISHITFCLWRCSLSFSWTKCAVNVGLVFPPPRSSCISQRTDDTETLNHKLKHKVNKLVNKNSMEMPVLLQLVGHPWDTCKAEVRMGGRTDEKVGWIVWNDEVELRKKEEKPPRGPVTSLDAASHKSPACSTSWLWANLHLHQFVCTLGMCASADISGVHLFRYCQEIIWRHLLISLKGFQLSLADQGTKSSWCTLGCLAVPGTSRGREGALAAQVWLEGTCEQITALRTCCLPDCGISALCSTRRRTTLQSQRNALRWGCLLHKCLSWRQLPCSPTRWYLRCQECTKPSWVLHTPASASLTGNPLMPLSPVRPACPCWK